MSRSSMNRRTFMKFGGAAAVGMGLLNFPFLVNGTNTTISSLKSKFSIRTPKWVVYDDGSFDLITNSISIKGCRPSLNGQAIMPRNVFLGDSPKGKRIVYELRQGFLMVDLKINEDTASLGAELSGFAEIPEWFSPISYGLVENVQTFFKQGLGYGGETGIYSLDDPLIYEKSDKVEDRNWSFDSFLTFSLINGQDTLAIGALDHNDYLHRSTLFNRTHRTTPGLTPDGHNPVFFESGFSLEKTGSNSEFLKLPDIHFIFGNKPFDTMQYLSWKIGRHMEARFGMCTCYHWSPNISDSDIFTFDMLQNQIEFLQQVETPVPIQSIQIKDDYCYHGDWLEANENWPGLDRTAREIFRHGYKAGIWIAPFKVDERSKLFKEHQNWLIHDESGEPLVKMVDKGINQYVLDSTNNDVRNYLYDVFRTLRKMGYTFFTTDYMDWGFKTATNVKRRYRGKTSVQIYRSFLKDLRKEMGEGSFWLSGNSPFAPMIGFVDGMKITKEINCSWENDGVDTILRESYFAQYFNNVFWQNDPNTLLLLDESCGLNEVEKNSVTLWNGILGGIINTSDNFKGQAESDLKHFRFLAPKQRPTNAILPFWPNLDEIKVAVRSYSALNSWGALFLNDKNESFTKLFRTEDLTGETIQWVYVWDEKEPELLGELEEIIIHLEPHESKLLYFSDDRTAPPSNLSIGGYIAEKI